MIFKVDFKKAFDSVKWDYLDETLKSFGFGLKWRNWISGCLNNVKGSVLVNGNPTKEFQFFKGLKQGDLLSLFLFILVMKTLHLSFAINRALLFKWVWRFFSDGSSLWSTFIKALFGFHGAIGLTVKPNRRSIWSDILQAVNSLKDKGIDFLQFIRKKIGNGVNTSFWADSWIGSIPFKEKFLRLYALEESKSISVADKLGLSSLYLSFRRPPRGGIEQESFNLLCQSVRGYADVALMWHPKNGVAKLRYLGL
ncbi:RNA-directed DNA polymerase, eukaryota, reverse transcriptase zinc-binding domain protein [Tanacetum coccineum]